MEIQLNAKYQIKALDRRTWALQELVLNKKSGKSGWISRSWYGTLKGALSDCLDNPGIVIDMETKEEHLAWLNKILEIARSIDNL